MLIQVQLEASSICHFDEREIASYFSRKTTQTPNTLMRFLVAMLCRNDKQVQHNDSSICHFDEGETTSYFSLKTTQAPNTHMRFLVAMLCRNDNQRHPELVSGSHPDRRTKDIHT